MKRFNYIICLLALVFAMQACDDDLTDLNVDPKNAQEIDAAPLFTYGQYNIAKQFVDIDYNANVSLIWANYFTQTTYIQESGYDAANRNVGGTIWDNIYTEGLYELARAKEILRSEEDLGEPFTSQHNNRLAMVKIMEVFAYQYLVDNFGYIPFREALDLNNITPVYESGETVYTAIADSLSSAISLISTDQTGFEADEDLIYEGDMTKWLKFAASLQLKIGLRVADINPTWSSELVTAAVNTGVFASNDDNTQIHFTGTQPYVNPIYDYFEIDSRASDFVVTQNFIDLLNDFNDPRSDVYFDDNVTPYEGGDYGVTGNAYEELTHPTESIVDASYAGTLMDYASVQFGLAEAVERGIITDGSAADYYAAGIRASFSYWGLSESQAADYLSQSSVNYATAEGTWREKIGNQKYIAFYGQGHEAWTEARRLDYPVLAVAPSSGLENPKRIIYPTEERLINVASYNAAISAMGADNTTTSIFWDVN
ncbi:SusD/RagB family nutrient-binding outer membrane lipoprotein [Fulvivirga maritima]|uniref:SusD/RagB family nutrient-binding outer membrane lipoprotein n=1 Tax=Fulvivirga maritima TaxID=2904247 RepID=UPI001F226055|nr:SusD/RagB family nutrient-binding outer membrane lipoprotein [Fulvivirga maritima]UII27987.1 SusD/RagB family nutrient-binding outer membrane lipoprotein [Fulvivirga maritima]